jgi:hypothetical protein
MTSVQLIADTNVISYIYAESPLGLAYEDLIESGGLMKRRWASPPSGIWTGESARGRDTVLAQ